MVLYLTILYVYSIKVLIEWEWPQGWIGWLVLSFSVLGILALLLLWPLSRRQENGWIPRFTRWFYIAILPLIGLLFAAIFRRISEYGITENRYFVLVLAIWLTGISLYFLLSKKKNIKVIPFSLALLSLIVSFGYWSAFSVSARSQAGRFGELLEKNGMLVDGKVSPATPGGLSDMERADMRSIITYLSERHQTDLLEEYLPVGTTLPASVSRDTYGYSEEVARLFDLDYGKSTYKGPIDVNDVAFDIYKDPSRSDDYQLLDVRGFDVVVPVEFYSMDVGSSESTSLRDFTFDGYSYTLTGKSQPAELSLSSEGTVVTIPLDSVLAEWITEDEEQHKSIEFAPYDDDGSLEREMPPAPSTDERELAVEGANGTLRVRLLVNNVSGFYQRDDQHKVRRESIRMTNIRMSLMVGRGTMEREEPDLQ